MRTVRSIAVAVALLPLPALAQDVPALTRAADAGDTVAQRQLGQLYRAGRAVPRDYARSFAYFTKAAAAGDPAAIDGLGYLYQHGLGVARDYGTAFTYFTRAAQAGYPQATSDLGFLYIKGYGVPKDYQTAFKYFSHAAAAGNADGISSLGEVYMFGTGVERDYATAQKYFLQAAALGNPQALNSLGVMYHNGLGVPRDLAKAFDYYSQAAAKGYAPAQNNLGRMYLNGLVVPKDVARAMGLFRAAGDSGFGAGYFNLGLIYHDGLDGVPVDTDAANDAFRRAVAAGYMQAASFIAAPPPPPPPPPPPSSRDFAPDAPAAPVAPPAVRLTEAKVPAGPRLALVIANGDYAPNLNTLANPVNDGKLIAAALTKAGFVVTPRYNLTVVQMKDALATFVDALHAAGPNATALFYYAGHGAAADGVNYLIPVGQAISSKTGLQTYGQSADEVLRLLDDARPVTTIVILDACRNVPFPGERGSDSGGLAQMDARNGSIIAYSTAPGHTAADGDGADSPYAAALADMIRQSNDPVEIVFRRVRKQVIEATQNEQTPWESTSLVSDFSFLQP